MIDDDTANYDTAMKAVAYLELTIMIRVLLGAVLFKNSFLMPVFYAHFLRQRYNQSTFTRAAVGDVKTRVEGFVRRPGTPPMAVQVWDKFTYFLSQWAGNVNIAPAAGAGAGPRRQ